MLKNLPARLGFALLLLAPALVFTLGEGLAQPAAPRPEELVLYPDEAGSHPVRCERLRS